MKPSSHGTRIRHAAAERSVIDGPFTETKELIGGFSIVDVGSKQEAIELAERVARIHAECGVESSRSKSGRCSSTANAAVGAAGRCRVSDFHLSRFAGEAAR